MAESLKIAMISSEYPPKWGGVGITSHFLANACAKEGHEVSVFTRRHGMEIPEKEPGITIEQVPWLKVPMAFTTSFGDNAVSSMMTSDVKFDLVHVHSNMALLRKKHYKNIKAPIVSTLHGTWWGERSMIGYSDLSPSIGSINDMAVIALTPMFDIYEDYAIELSNAVIVESISECMAISKRGLKNKYDKVRRLPPGVDISSFHPRFKDREAFTELGIREGAPVILHVGRLAARKGVSYLLTAFAKVLKNDPSAILVLVGEGPQDRALRQICKRLGITGSVIFAGIFDFPKLRAAYASADVFAVHSLWEGFGLIYLESLASGIPCVSSNVGAASEVIRDGRDGFITPLYDTDAMADRLSQLVNDPAMRKRMGRSGRKRMVTNYSWMAVAKETVELYREVIDDPTNDRRKSKVGRDCMKQ